MSDKSYPMLCTDALLARLQAAEIEARIEPYGPDDVRVVLIVLGGGVTAREALLDALAVCGEVTQ